MKTFAPEIARVLLEAGAVVLRPEQPFKFASGLLSPMYCDNRLLLGQVAARKTVAKALAQLVDQEVISAEVIAGTATAGIPWAAWVADELMLPMVYVRSSSKGHGRGQQVEGGVLSNQRVVLIEDLISTGGSALKAVGALRELEVSVAECCAIFSYNMPIAQTNFASAGVRMISLTTLAALLDMATDQGYIRDDQRSMITDWSSDPEGWAVRNGFVDIQ